MSPSYRRTLHAVGTLLVALLLASNAACQSSTEALAAHVEAMAALAEQADGDCSKVAPALQDYLKTHRDDLEALAAKHGEGKPAVAQRIHGAAERLDGVIEACSPDPALEAFKKDFSAIVLDATALAKKP